MFGGTPCWLRSNILGRQPPSLVQNDKAMTDFVLFFFVPRTSLLVFLLHLFYLRTDIAARQLCLAGGVVVEVLIKSMRFIMILNLGQESIARLLGVTKQHGSVGLVKDGVVDGSIANSERALHNDHLLGKPYFENRHSGNDGIGVLFSSTVDRIVCANDQHQISFLMRCNQS